MIKNVIFDIGQVMIGWHPQLSALYDEKTAGIVEEAIWSGDEWNQLDLGVISEEELFARMVSRAPEYEEQIRYTLGHLEMVSTRKEYAIPWVKKLKDMGYNVYFLSNYSRHLRKAVPQIIDFIPYMDGGIWSCDVKLLKPDSAIYQKILDTYHLVPEQCLFIDDRLENVQGARNMGIHSLQFKGYEESYEEIMNYLAENA